MVRQCSANTLSIDSASTNAAAHNFKLKLRKAASEPALLSALAATADPVSPTTEDKTEHATAAEPPRIVIALSSHENITPSPLEAILLPPGQVPKSPIVQAASPVLVPAGEVRMRSLSANSPGSRNSLRRSGTPRLNISRSTRCDYNCLFIYQYFFFVYAAWSTTCLCRP